MIFKKSQEKLQQEIGFLRQEISNRLLQIGELTYNFLANSNDLVNQTKAKVIKLNKLQNKLAKEIQRTTKPAEQTKTKQPKRNKK